MGQAQSPVEQSDLVESLGLCFSKLRLHLVGKSTDSVGDPIVGDPTEATAAHHRIPSLLAKTTPAPRLNHRHTRKSGRDWSEPVHSGNTPGRFLCR